jgi:hypothetical protein
VLAQGFPDPLGVRGADALVDGQGLLPVRGGVAGVAVLEQAVAEAFQGAGFLRRSADLAGDGQRLGVVFAGLWGLMTASWPRRWTVSAATCATR